MNSSSSGYRDNSVVFVVRLPVRLYMLGLEFLGFTGAEVISGAHEVCPIRVLLGIQFHLLQHVERFSCVSTTS
jgi:hypothetical protein